MVLQHALQLAERGFYVFPVEPNGKRPVISDWPNKATRDKAQIEKWFTQSDYNVGVATGKFGDDAALIVIDVDNKQGKHGDETLLALELTGHELPASFEQSTPSGGRHIIYRASVPVRQGVNVLGEGLDIRSGGGFIVGTGSTIDGRQYAQINGHFEIAPAPDWLVHRLGNAGVRVRTGDVPVLSANPDRASLRSIEYLATAPIAIEGQGGDITTYKVAARLKDFGCTAQQTYELMLEHWNPRCEPPWGWAELNDKVYHAFKYGKETPGIAAPEAVFTPAVKDNAETDNAHPVDELNKEYAFIKAGAFVLQETTDAKGRFTILRLTVGDMHAWFANKSVEVGDKSVPLSKLWMTRKGRREFDNVVFSPEKPVPPRFYNLWRGFAYEPAATTSHPSVDAFLDHALNNVCHGSKELCHWLLGFFAHMIQRPWEKPLVALVFKGLKGTGKNALVERVGALLGRHFLVASDQRYLLGNFNSHLENNLFFVLDEASWAGDKRAEGKLKDLITGSEHLIERKGFEPYTVDNLTRIALIGNENWLVPASTDERRFAVFAVSDARRQDRKYFQDMREGMEQGGYPHLLRFFLDFDLTGVDLNAAPQTQGLIDQKHASLEPLPEWWLDCLQNNALVGSTWDGVLPAEIPTNRMREAFDTWVKSRNIRSRLPGKQGFNRLMGQMAVHMERVKSRPEDPKDATYAFRHNGIDELRKDWELFIGGKVRWED